MTNKFYRSYTFETRTLYPNMNFILNFLPIYVMLAVHDFQVVVCTNHVCFLHRFKGAVNTRAIANRHHIRGRNATSISFEGLVRTDHGRTDMLNSVFKKATRRSVLVEYCDKLLNVVENYTVEYGVQCHSRSSKLVEIPIDFVLVFYCHYIPIFYFSRYNDLVERWSLIRDLSLSCALPAADG